MFIPRFHNEGNTFLLRDESGGAGHWLREATVTGLPELFNTFGHMATARGGAKRG